MNETSRDFVATGGCLCGAVRYGLKEKLGPVGFCHCSKCRRTSGTGSNAVLNVPLRRFEWVAGEDNVQTYSTAEGWTSLFCRTCGSPAPHVLPDGKRVLVPAGTLDGDPELGHSNHIFVASKARWEVIGGDATQFDTWPS